MTPPRSTLRADAQRNRERLIATAAEVFASGRAISLDAIAKRAGVGNATLYRHFTAAAVKSRPMRSAAFAAAGSVTVAAKAA